MHLHTLTRTYTLKLSIGGFLVNRTKTTQITASQIITITTETTTTITTTATTTYTKQSSVTDEEDTPPPVIYTVKLLIKCSGY